MHLSSFIGAAFVVSAVSAQPLDTRTLSPITVSDQALPASQLDPKLSLAGKQTELGKTLDLLPGVSLRQQGAHAGEPVLRGLGWERVTTQYNGLSLYGACPSRMDPPVSIFQASSLQSTLIEMGPASVIHGPLSTGGRIRISDELSLSEPGEKSAESSVQAGYDSNGKGRSLSANRGVRTDKQAWRVDLGIDKSGDYFSGDGKRVPAGASAEKASAQWKSKLSDDLIFSLSTRWIYDKDVIYLALPMDSRYAKTNLTTGSLQWQPTESALSELRFRAGVGTIDHLMDNRDKPNRKLMEASTPSTVDSYDIGILSRWNLNQGELRVGTDASILERDALRTRIMKATGMVLKDPIWPDLSREQVGLFGEWESTITPSLTLRSGARLDYISSDTGKADAMIMPGPGIGKTTVGKAWQDIGGSTGSDPSQDDTLASANLVLSQSLSETWLAQVGFSRVEAQPNLTQRYLSFGPVPGGFGIGTPSLDPETKYEIEMRTEGQIGQHRLGFAAFASRINDYLLPTTVAMTDVNGDGKTDRVKGTVNQDAEMWGLETSLRLHLTESLSLPVNLSWVRGQTTKGQDLPEIPPLEMDASLMWEGQRPSQTFAEFGVRFAYRQEYIDPGFGEDETPSFAVFHLRCGMEIRPGWTLEAGIENLFDREYNEHLTREVLLPTADLASGEEVPAPGRSFNLSTRFVW
jgi:iron complex outermembrane receptor protein